MKTIAVFGLGKLGLPFLACAASRGFYVIGVDVNRALLDTVAKKKSPYDEPELGEYLERYQGQYEVTPCGDEAVRRSDASFIFVPTPSMPSGEFSTTLVERAVDTLGVGLRSAPRHLVVLSSTILPGASERVVIPTLEAASRKKCGADFSFCYGPEFVALGSVVRDMLRPQFALIGQYDAHSGSELDAFLSAFLPAPLPPFCKMSIVNAEIAKLAVNTFVTTKIAYANLLASICDRLPGAHVDVVTDAIGNDPRIGRRYLTGGMGYGGPCFPRDNGALAACAKALGVSSLIPESIDAYNRAFVDTLVERALNRAPHIRSVAVLGLSYKCDTTVVEESQGIHIAEAFLRAQFPVTVYDRLETYVPARNILGDRVTYAETLNACVADTDAVVITLPDRRFALSPAMLKNGGRGVLVVDPWRMLTHVSWGDVWYYGVGIGQ